MAVSTRCHKPDKCSIKMHLITMRQREREREREREKERDRERESVCASVCVTEGERL